MDLGAQPIVNQLTLEQDAHVELFPMKVGGCMTCGLIQLTAPIDPSRFYTDYATPTAWKREPHIVSLLQRLEKLLNADARILDVGCNDGRFLSELVGFGWRDVSGIEPTKNTSEIAQSRGFRVLHGGLNLEVAQKFTAEGGAYDCVTVRQVLEHICDLSNFGRSLNQLLKMHGILVVEVPDSRTNVLHADYALWEEHVNYFTPETLGAFLSAYGFSIVESYTSKFSGVCLTVIAQKIANLEKEHESVVLAPENLNSQVKNFQEWAHKYPFFVELVQQELSEVSTSLPVVLYGVGSRSSTFVNLMGVSSLISVAIDDQPEKQGKYMPQSGVAICSSDQAQERFGGEDFFALLGVNGENEDSLLEGSPFLSKKGCASILPPSHRLLEAWTKLLGVDGSY